MKCQLCQLRPALSLQLADSGVHHIAARLLSKKVPVVVAGSIMIVHAICENLASVLQGTTVHRYLFDHYLPMTSGTLRFTKRSVTLLTVEPLTGRVYLSA